MPTTNTTALEALKKLHGAMRDRHYGRMPDEVQAAYDHAATTIAALESSAPSAVEPVAFDLTQARAIVVDAIRRMRAAHVDCHDLTMLAEDFLHSTHAAAKTDELWDKTLEDRDNYHEWADQLASRIATITGTEIGEHSSANNPWSNAINAAEYYLATPPAPAPSAASEREALTDEHWQGIVNRVWMGLPEATREAASKDSGELGLHPLEIAVVRAIVDAQARGWREGRAALHSTGKPDVEVAQDQKTWCGYVAGMVVAYLGGGVDDARIGPIARIIERRLWALAPADQQQGKGAAP